MNNMNENLRKSKPNENEEKEKLLNQNNISNPNINNNQIAVKENWVYVNPSIYFSYFLLNGIAIIIGTLCKLFYPISRQTIGKNSFLTGIPLLRRYFFLFPFSMNAVYFIWCIFHYLNNVSIRNKYDHDFIKYLKNIRCGFLFSNITLLIMFYVLYYRVYMPIYHLYGFRLSGHMLSSLLSGAMIVHLVFTYEPFIARNISLTFNYYFRLANIFLYFHSIYTIISTSWIFHTLTELILSFLISMIVIIIIHIVNVDCLMLNLIDWNSVKRRSVILYR